MCGKASPYRERPSYFPFSLIRGVEVSTGSGSDRVNVLVTTRSLPLPVLTSAPRISGIHYEEHDRKGGAFPHVRRRSRRHQLRAIKSTPTACSHFFSGVHTFSFRFTFLDSAEGFKLAIGSA